MDRSRPLWEFYVVEGLADAPARSRFYTKVHHAAVDGKAGVALGNAMLDMTPRAARRQAAAPAPRATATSSAWPNCWAPAASNTAQAAPQPAGAAPGQDAGAGTG